jgi:hypothetical protein
MIEADNDKVICPECAHQFSAIPVNVQKFTNRLLEQHKPDQITQVYEFNDLMGFPYEPPVHMPTTETVLFMLKSIEEEHDELQDALNDGDLVKVVDAILDLTYFAYGHLHRMGVTREQAQACFAAVHAANMTKGRGKLASRGNFENDAVKPADFVPPDEKIRAILLTGVLDSQYDEDYRSSGSEQVD